MPYSVLTRRCGKRANLVCRITIFTQPFPSETGSLSPGQLIVCAICATVFVKSSVLARFASIVALASASNRVVCAWSGR